MYFPYQRVVCVKGFHRWSVMNPGIRVPKVLEEFTVAEVTQGKTMQGLILAELKCPVLYGWAAYQFRPIVKRKTDISGLKALLNVTELSLSVTPRLW